MAAFERFSGNAGLAQPGRGPFAEFLPLLADNDDRRLAGKLRRPFLHITVGAPHGAGDQARIGGKIVIDAYIDKGRCLGGTNETGEFIG
jgi:hypothetical protein